MEINRQLRILAIAVAASFLLAASWSLPAFAAGTTSTETQAKAVKKKVARNTKGAAKLIKPRIARAQPANVSGKTAAVPYSPCVPYWSGPVYTWGVPATAGASSGQIASGTTQAQWPRGANGAAQLGSSQIPQAPPSSGVSPGGFWYSVWVPCSNAPTPSWNAPATAGPSVGQSYGPPIQEPAAPGTSAAAPVAGAGAPQAQVASAGPCGIVGPFQWLWSALKPPCF